MSDGNNSFDAIVIGSGTGGLAVAGILAKLNDKRVLVLEKHFQLGGLTHEFSRGRFKWDVGLHYVGELGPGDIARDIYDYLTDGELKWTKMPHIFERFLYPDISLDVPSEPGEYLAKLADLFPAEKAALHDYFKDVERVAAWHRTYMIAKALPDFVPRLFNRLNTPTKRLALLSVQEYLDRNFSDDRLKAVLVSQWGDYGVPPHEAAFAIHALIVNHYLQGAYFPVGGASSIVKHIAPIIERAGGALLAGHEVTELIVEDGAVKGVVTSYPKGPDIGQSRFYAPIVVSNVGAVETYKRFLAPHVPLPKELATLPKGLSAVTVYLGLKQSPEQLEIKGENFWLFDTYDHDKLAGDRSMLLEGRPAFCYLSFPSLKNPEAHCHTAELIAFVDYEQFAAFAKNPWRRRQPEYYALKDKIEQGLLALVERHIPGFKDLVAYAEVSTPLSLEEFTSRSRGVMYGVPAVPKKYTLPWLTPRTPLKDFYLSGSDVGSLGIVGALIGGVACASALNGPFGFLKIVVAAKREARRRSPSRIAGAGVQPFTRKQPLPGELVARVSSKRRLAGTFWELTLGLSDRVHFVPGQHMYLQVGPNEWRPYDVVRLSDGDVTFIVDVAPGGRGSEFVLQCQIGDELLARHPQGTFGLEQTGNPEKIFIATGSGIAPFFPMLSRLAENGDGGRLRLLWGVRDESQEFAALYLKDVTESTALEMTPCVSGAAAGGRFYSGRVTEKLRELALDFGKCDFYLCGNPAMVYDAHRFLRSKGATSIHFAM